MNRPVIVAVSTSGAAALLLMSAMFAPACGGPERSSPSAPAAASPSARASATTGASKGSRTPEGSSPSTASGPGAATGEAGIAATQMLRFPARSGEGQGIIPFPPRNEPNAFFQDLQALYRDFLLRPQTAPSYVDPEGENVWLTEYFRFYLNGCSHEQAMSRTVIEITTGGTQPVCGAERLDFPPRNLPNEFQGVLEATYRDVLRRSQILSYVDTEGANVWLAQYLRFRVNGCDHFTAENKVFMEIRGGGVQPVCIVATTSTTSTTSTTTTSPTTTTTTVPALPPLTASFTVGGGSDNCVVNLSCAFDASASSGSGTRTFRWTFGDGNTLTTTAPVTQKTYLCGVGSGASVQVTVRLEVTDQTSRPAAINQRTITVTRPGCG